MPVTRGSRHNEVRDALDRVTDPELDEPVTDLGFIRSVEIGSDGVVDIAFRLPTYWCSANFAYLMADDMRREVGALPWTKQVRPRLLDHLYADRINAGVAKGESFKQVFGDEIADKTLEALRAKFQRKAFQRRQEAVLHALVAADVTPSEILGLTLLALEKLEMPADDWPTKRQRYLEMRRCLAHGPLDDGDSAFVDLDGVPLTEQRFAAHLETLRSVRLNMEFNGALCRGLLAAREESAGEPGNRAYVASEAD